MATDFRRTGAAGIRLRSARFVLVLADLRKPLTDDRSREILFGKDQYKARGAQTDAGRAGPPKISGHDSCP